MKNNVDLYSDQDTTIRDILKSLHRPDIKSEFVPGPVTLDILVGLEVKYDVDIEDPDDIICAWFVEDYALVLSSVGKAWYVYPSGFEEYESSSTYNNSDYALKAMMRHLFECELDRALESIWSKRSCQTHTREQIPPWFSSVNPRIPLDF